MKNLQAILVELTQLLLAFGVAPKERLSIHCSRELLRLVTQLADGSALELVYRSSTILFHGPGGFVIEFIERKNEVPVPVEDKGTEALLRVVLEQAAATQRENGRLRRQLGLE